eukprot:COSAG05_NODE_1093_length_5913_cov_38.151703_5_plen_149_part_00
MHLYMVTLDSLLTVQMARCTASQVDDYKGIKYLGFSPARPILKPFQRALTNIKLDGQTLAPNDQIELRKQLHRNRIATVDAANAEAAAIHSPGGKAPGTWSYENWPMDEKSHAGHGGSGRPHLRLTMSDSGQNNRRNGSFTSEKPVPC